MRITSAEFRSNVLAVHGPAGATWLSDIPRLLSEIEQSWDVCIGPPYELSYNYVAPAARRGGSACVVKLTVPGTSDRNREAAALTTYAGRGAVRLLARDDSRGAFLLERAEPGLTLAELGPDQDTAATAVICALMQRLWCMPPADHMVPDVADYGADFVDYRQRHPTGGPLPRRLVERATELIEVLSATAPRTVLLHGDLHHHNVLQSHREPWLAIDPHGLTGCPGFDVGAMLYNPTTMSAEELLRLLPARLEQLCAIPDLDPDRVRGWAFVMSMLSEVWSAQDHNEIDGRPLAVAQQLDSRLH